VRLLETLNPNDYQFVRLSIISQFGYEKQLSLFKSRAKLIFLGFKNEKRNVLEKAITLTNDKNIMLNMNQLSNIILTARDFPKLSREELNRYENITLDRWIEEGQKEKNHAIFNNKDHLLDAFTEIADRHFDFSGKAELVSNYSAKVNSVFNKEGIMPLSNV
jgi:hypothetical protein